LRLPQSGRFSGWTRHRSPGVSPAVFLAHPPDLQPWPLMDMDFATSCPLVRPYLPRIRLLFVGSRFRSTLPSDGPSRFRPCASLVLHLHQVAQGTFTPRLPDMPGTQEALRRLRRCLLGLLDRGWPQHPWDVGPGRGNGPFNRARKRGEASRFKGRDIVTIHRVVLPMCPVQSVTHVPG